MAYQEILTSIIGGVTPNPITVPYISAIAPILVFRKPDGSNYSGAVTNTDTGTSIILTGDGGATFQDTFNFIILINSQSVEPPVYDPIVQVSDFTGDNQVVNKFDADVYALLNQTIDKREPEFLKMLFGCDFYNVFEAGINADPVDQRWPDLIAQTDLKPAIVDFVYFYWIRKNARTLMAAGNSQMQSANAITIDSKFTQSETWNEMVKYVYKIIKFITASGNYPEYVEPQWLIWRMQDYNWWLQDYYLYPRRFNPYCIPEIFNSINSLNL